jgi:uncharacterized cupin superfamily protein
MGTPGFDVNPAKEAGPKVSLAFPWTCGETEISFLLEGKMTVTRPDGETTSFGQGDLLTFPDGLFCAWKILKDVKKN